MMKIQRSHGGVMEVENNNEYKPKAAWDNTPDQAYPIPENPNLIQFSTSNYFKAQPRIIGHQLKLKGNAQTPPSPNKSKTNSTKETNQKENNSTETVPPNSSSSPTMKQSIWNLNFKLPKLPKLPNILPFNSFITLILVPIVIVLIYQLYIDFESKIQFRSIEKLKEQQKSILDYKNSCADIHPEAQDIKNACRDLEICMDPSFLKINRSKVLVEIVAELINGFISTLDIKTIVVLSGGIILTTLLLNISKFFSSLGNKQSSQAQEVKHYLCFDNQHPNSIRNQTSSELLNNKDSKAIERVSQTNLIQ